MVMFSVFKFNFAADDLPWYLISSKRLNSWSGFIIVISIFWIEEFKDTDTVDADVDDVEAKVVVNFSVVVKMPIKSSKKCTTETLWVPLKYDMIKGSFDLDSRSF